MDPEILFFSEEQFAFDTKMRYQEFSKLKTHQRQCFESDLGWDALTFKVFQRK